MEEFLVKKGLSLLKKERMLIDKIISSNERDDNLSFADLQEMFSTVSSQTDEIIEKLANDLDYGSLKEMILSDIKQDSEETLDKFTLVKLISYKMLDEVSNNFTTLDNSVFEEEHFKYLYSVYMWYIKNNELSSVTKKSLHKSMLIKAVGSNALRNFYAGNYDAVNSLGDPEQRCGIIPDKILSHCYSYLFNDLLNEVGCSAMFNSFFKDKSFFESNKKFLTLRFTALSLQMIDRKVFDLDPDRPLSDFVKDLLSDASLLSEQFKKGERNQNRKVIKL